MEGVAAGVEAIAAVGALDTAGVQAIAEEATAALQGVVVCHRLVGAVLAGHQSVDVTNLPPIAMGIAVAGARAVCDVWRVFYCKYYSIPVCYEQCHVPHLKDPPSTA